MAKFRKKPVEIEAFRFPTNQKILKSVEPEWFKAAIRAGSVYYQGGDRPYFTIDTPEGVMRARPGDYIIRGVSGEIYPCKADIFAQTYEPVEE